MYLSLSTRDSWKIRLSLLNNVKVARNDKTVEALFEISENPYSQLETDYNRTITLDNACFIAPNSCEIGDILEGKCVNGVYTHSL